MEEYPDPNYILGRFAVVKTHMNGILNGRCPSATVNVCQSKYPYLVSKDIEFLKSGRSALNAVSLRAGLAS
jgi:hypothetical protein